MTVTIDVNPTKKYIDIWLERGEEAPDVSAFHAHNKDYQIVIWRSGAGDLAGLTAELLRNNRDFDAPVKPMRAHRQGRELSR
jgi:hypothetical protein